MNEIEYILRIILRARDETAAAFKSAREELRLFVNAIDGHTKKLDAFNNSMSNVEKNIGSVTEKLREWRAVMQGLGDDNNDASKSVGELGKQLDGNVRKTREATTNQTKLRSETARLRKEYDEFDKSVKAGTRSNQEAVDGYKRLGRELDSVGNRLKVNGRWWRENRELAHDVKAQAQGIIDAEKAKVKAANDAARERVNAAKAVEREQNRIARAAEREAATAARRVEREAAQSAARIARAAEADAKKVQEFENLKIKAAERRERVIRMIDEKPSIHRRDRADFDVELRSQLGKLSQEYSKLSNHAKASADDEDRFANAATRAKNELRNLNNETSKSSGFIAQLGKAFDRNSGSLSQFDNQLRGLGMLLLVGFAQQLITVITALGGQLVALAGSAAMAGAALGGAFVAGIGQALPALGIFAAAMFRVKSVMDAVNQAQMLQQQTATRAPAAARRQANASDAVTNAEEALKNAHEGVADAQDRLGEAQGKLGDARRQARRDLEDLIRAENDAKLAAIGAALSQKEAQQALIRAQQQGDVEGIQRAQLAVLQAQADAEDKITQKRRASADAQKAQRGGVEGMPGVKQAKKDIEDAQRAAEKAAEAVGKAERGLEKARRQGDAASAGAETAAAKLQFLLAQLSPAERRLYEAMTKLQTLFRTGPFRDITDNLVDSFARAINKIADILQRPSMLKSAGDLAKGMSAQFDRIFDAFTSDKMLAQFRRITNAGKDNLKPLADIIINLGKSFANIAEEAGPALHRLLDFIKELTGGFRGLTDRRKTMTDFFLEGEKHLEAWVRLIVSVIRLFMALTGAGGASSGLRSVQDATKAIDGLTDKVHKNRESVAKFFEDSRRTVYRVVDVLVALGKELFKSFTPERVDKFAKLLTEVVIPALGDVVDILGKINNVIVEFADTDLGKNIMKAVVASFLLYNVFGTALSTLTKMRGAVDLIGAGVKGIKGFGGARGAARGGLTGGAATAETFLGGGAAAGGEAATGAAGLAAAAGPALLIAAAIAAAVAGVVILLQHFHKLDDVWKAIKKGFSDFIKDVKPALASLGDAFKDLNQLGADLDTILRPLATFIATYLITVIQGAFRYLGGLFVGLIRTISGVIKLIRGLADILIGIFTLDTDQILGGFDELLAGFDDLWHAIIDGFLKAFEGLGEIMLAPFIAAWDAIKDFFGIGSPSKLAEDLGNDIIDGLKEGLKLAGRIISAPFRAAWRAAKAAFTDPVGFAEHLVRRFVNGIRGIVGLVARAAEFLWDHFKKAFPGPAAFAESLVRRFANGIRNIAGAVRDAAFYLWGRFKDAFANVRKFGEGIVHDIVSAIRGLPGAILNMLKDIGGSLLDVGKKIGGKVVEGVKSVVGSVGKLFSGGDDDKKPAPRAQPQAQPRVVAKDTNIPFGAKDLKEAAQLWSEFWAVLRRVARSSTNVIQKEFRDMRVDTARNADLMYRRVRSSLDDIEHSFQVRGTRLVNRWDNTWFQLKKITFDGLNYIGHEANKALSGFSVKTINFGLTAPPATGKAGGGWVGNRGARGRDKGLYALGAGEAVLNWAHQKYVEPALNAYYGFGLDTLFSRTSAYHAGGPGQATGFAEGGRAGGGDSHWNRLIAAMNKVSAKNWPYHWGGGHEQPANFEPFDCSGSVSYVTQQAGYKVPTSTSGNIGGWGFPKGSGPVTIFYNPVHTFMRAGGRYFGTSGFARPNGGAGWFTKEPSASYLAGFKMVHLPGIDKVGDYFATGVGGDIARLIVKGPKSAMKSFIQAVFDKVVDGANQYISSKAPTGESGVGQPGDGSPAPPGQHRDWIKEGLRLAGVPTTTANINAQYKLDMGESGGNPKIVQQIQDINSQTGNLARGIAQVIPPTFKQYMVPGHGDIFNPVDNIAASARYQIARYGHLVGHSGYAKGGIVPGGDGTPVPAIVHAGEWILNKVQQARLAGLTGLHPKTLASMLGFHGGKGHFQGGTSDPNAAEPSTKRDADKIADRTAKDVKKITDKRLKDLLDAVAKMMENFTGVKDKILGIATKIGTITSWSTEIDKELDVLGKVASRVTRRRTKAADASQGVLKFADAMDNLIGETGAFSRLRASIERRTARIARRRIFQRFTVGAGRQIGQDTRYDEEEERAMVALRDLRDERGPLTRERRDIRRAQRQVSRQLRRKGLSVEARERLRTEQTNLDQMYADADQRVADNLQSIYDAQQAYVQAALEAQQKFVENINNRYERALGGVERAKRMADALGLDTSVFAQQSRDLLTGQMQELQGRVQSLRSVGGEEANKAADALQDQIEDLRVQIFESIQQSIADAADRINQTAQRRLGRIDLAGRLLDAMGTVGMGGAASLFGSGETFSRGGLYAQRQAAYQTQRAGLVGVLGQAQGQGNVKLIQDLTDQIAELDVTIQENTKAYFDARFDDVQSRRSYSQSVDDLKIRIIDLKGEVTGFTDTAAKLAIIQKDANELQETHNKLQELYNEAVAAGNQEGMEKLTIALLENEAATWENTKAFNEASGAMQDPQTFTSSAWSWFREAIFSGMGQVLPQYDPSNAGAIITGAQIVPGGNSTTNNGGSVITNIYEAGQPLDVTAVTSAIVFASKTAQ